MKKGTRKATSKIRSKAAAAKKGAPRNTSALTARSARARRAEAALQRLKKAYPESTCALKFKNPFQLLVATILSAQCTDVMVNKVTPALFKAYPVPKRLAAAEPETLEGLIRSTGFYRNKAKSLLGCSRALVDEFGGRVPETLEELITLKGVARKTANVVLGTAFGQNEGIVVDTHVKRLAGRLGYTKETNPDKIEKGLMPLFPREDWTLLGHMLIDHGRAVCAARKPKCDECVLADICPSCSVRP